MNVMEVNVKMALLSHIGHCQTRQQGPLVYMLTLCKDIGIEVEILQNCVSILKPPRFALIS